MQQPPVWCQPSLLSHDYKLSTWQGVQWHGGVTEFSGLQKQLAGASCISINRVDSVQDIVHELALTSSLAW